MVLGRVREWGVGEHRSACAVLFVVWVSFGGGVGNIRDWGWFLRIVAVQNQPPILHRFVLWGWVAASEL